jgi:hypothetical protein
VNTHRTNGESMMTMRELQPLLCNVDHKLRATVPTPQGRMIIRSYKLSEVCHDCMRAACHGCTGTACRAPTVRLSVFARMGITIPYRVHLANPAGVLFFGYFLFAQAKESNLSASTTPRWINVQCRLLTSGAEHIVVQKYRHMQLTTRRNWRYAD